jgi:hypothetical protein
MISAILSLAVARFIRSKAREFQPEGSPIEAGVRVAVESFFPRELLDSVRIVTGREVPDPFVARLGRRFRLGEIPSFRNVAAVTFSNFIVFHEPVCVSVLFHELVHVMQYQQLGVGKFARLYVRGLLRKRRYEAIPLEQHAYELGARFDRDQHRTFSVQEEVARRVRNDLY